jgi:hypothetical protein
MFDANYFRTALARDVESAGGSPVVELLLLGGHVHRIRSIVDVGTGHVTLEAYSMRGDLSHERPRFGGGDTSIEVVRIVVSYESIASIVFDPAPEQVKARPGFASR